MTTARTGMGAFNKLSPYIAKPMSFKDFASSDVEDETKALLLAMVTIIKDEPKSGFKVSDLPETESDDNVLKYSKDMKDQAKQILLVLRDIYKGKNLKLKQTKSIAQMLGCRMEIAQDLLFLSRYSSNIEGDLTEEDKKNRFVQYHLTLQSTTSLYIKVKSECERLMTALFGTSLELRADHHKHLDHDIPDKIILFCGLYMSLSGREIESWYQYERAKSDSSLQMIKNMTGIIKQYLRVTTNEYTGEEKLDDVLSLAAGLGYHG
jgi:hypothetical protein